MENTEVLEKDATTEVAEKEVKQPSKERAEPTIVFFDDAKVVCACGNSFTTGSTKKEIHVEICSNCHPFFTGQEKFVDTEGRVERFQRLSNAKRDIKPKKSTEAKKDDTPKTLKEMLMSLDKK